MTLPIRWKIAFSTLVAITVGLLAAGWLALQSIERLELTRLEETLTSRTALAAVSLQPLIDTDSPPFSAPQLQSMVKTLSSHALARVTVIAPDGLVLADSDTANDAVTHLDNHRARPEVAQVLAGGRGTNIRLSATTGKRMFYLALPLRSSDERLIAIVRLALPMTALDARIREFEHALGVAFGIALAMAAVLSVVLSRGLTRPLSDMATVARQLAAGSLRQRIATTARDEIGVLGNALDHMADQLESIIREVTEDRAQLLAVLSSMAEGVMVLDCRGVVLQVNTALERILLIQSGTARGRTYQDVIRLQELDDLVTAVLETRVSRSGEVTTVPSGHTLHIEASVAGGRLENEACVVLVFHDVTAIRRLEKVRKDFVANVSHELRTPLTSIKGYVEALLDGIIKDHPDEALRFLHIILKQSDRLNLILDDLLQLSQIESGQVLFKREPVSLRSVVERTVALIQPILDKKNHHLTVSLPDVLPSVLGDEERLVQVLTNLLDNAVKYTPQGGTIVIAARHVDAIQTDTPSDLVELSVSDNGIGIPEADRPRVFERFYRVDKARSRELGGTGLGLAIVKHIVEGHGGQIWVEPNQPTGTRFVMTLAVEKRSN